MRVDGFFVPVSALIDAYRSTYREATGRQPSKRTLLKFLKTAYAASPVKVDDGLALMFEDHLSGEPK